MPEHAEHFRSADLLKGKRDSPAVRELPEVRTWDTAAWRLQQLKQFYESEKQRLEQRFNDEKERNSRRTNELIKEHEQKLREESNNHEDEMEMIQGDLNHAIEENK